MKTTSMIPSAVLPRLTARPSAATKLWHRRPACVNFTEAAVPQWLRHALLVCILLPVWTGLTAPLLAGEQAEYEKFIAQKAPVLVTVKFVLKREGRFGDRETEREITAIMIDPKGLVLCSSSQLGVPPFMRRFGSATPTDIKVLIGDDTEGLEAKLLARDSELDLAWIQIKEPGDQTFACLDLTKAVVPAIGDRLLVVRRMGRYFDRAPVVSEGRLCGKTGKPRDLFVPGGALDLEPGLPVYAANGALVGIAVIQTPDPEEMENSALSLLNIGREMFGGLILPADEVLKATLRAKETAQEDEEEDREVSKTEDEKKESIGAEKTRQGA